MASVAPPDELLRRARFVDVVEWDGTEEFRVVAKNWIDQWDEHRDALIQVYGETDFDTRQRERRGQLRAVEDGLLRRSLFVGGRLGARKY